MVEYLEMSLQQVRSVPVKTQRIELSELKIREPKKKEMTTVEASMRLDAVASAGFAMSRSKMADLIDSGDVRVNWKDVTQASYNVKSGDLIAVTAREDWKLGKLLLLRRNAIESS
jgi:RNA-binding protein YlmH